MKKLAQKTIADCCFVKDTTYDGIPGKTTLLLPSGDEKYVSFWVRDCAMMAESGLIPDEELKKYVEIIALYGQNGEETVYLAHGLTVPPFAIADHINYNGRPVFFPGTYRDTQDQGNGTYGYFPPFCDNYYFIMLAGFYIRQSGDRAILNNIYKGRSLAERLEKAFAGYQIAPETGLCRSEDRRYTVDWGFVDCVKKTGLLLMASLLRYSAAHTLETLFAADVEKQAYYRQRADQIAENILKIFYDEATGWLYSATGMGRQHDVWATAYAVYLGVLQEPKTLERMAQAYQNQTVTANGYIRHILLTEDFSETSAWEYAQAPYNTYQNGAYWATPLGWYAVALYQYDPVLADKILGEFVQHTEKYLALGAPFEWINRDTADFSGRHYGTSGVLPYVGLRKILSIKRAEV